ncbi:MAG: S-layer homology domain-containing protein [Slackia sp.]|nr:S-layer homology domain-containing protein [Slackia sp.]
MPGCAQDESAFVELKQGRSAAEYNTQTLQQAINAASYQGGGSLLLPAGTFYFAWSHEDDWNNCAIIARDNVSIKGAGMDETFLKPLGSYSEEGEAAHGVDMFLHEGAESGDCLTNADFADFTIDGSAAHGDPAQYNSSGKGFSFTLFKDCDWNRVKTVNTDGTGFGVDFPIDCTMTDCVAIRCGKNATASSYGASGFGIGTGYSEEESIVIENCTAYDNTKYGFFFEHQTTFDNPATKSPRAHGFVVRDCEASGNLYNFGGNRANDVRFIECRSNVSASAAREAYTRYAFQFHNYSTRITVESSAISQAYEDVTPDHSCYESVEWALERNIAEVGSDGSNTFRPHDEATRGEAAVFLWRYAGRPGKVVFGSNVDASCPTQDVPAQSYYAEAVRWMKDDGLSNADPFKPEEAITYEELALILQRYADLLEAPESEASDAAHSATSAADESVETLPEETKTPRSATDAVAWATENDLFPCDEAKEDPNQTCTREGLIAMIHAFDSIRS